MEVEWTGKEIGTLKRNFYLYRIEYLKELLPGRTVAAIRQQANRVGLRKRNWLTDYIKNHPGLRVVEISDQTGSDKRTIRKILKSLENDI